MSIMLLSPKMDDDTSWMLPAFTMTSIVDGRDGGFLVCILASLLCIEKN
jgi:hypothetical protein